MKPYSAGLLSLSILFFALFIVAGILNYFRHFKIKYNVRNMFPFEINYKVNFSLNLYNHLFLVLFIMSSIGFYATFDTTYSNGFLIFTMIGGIISSIVIFLLFYVPLVNLRFHVILDAIFFTIVFATIGSLLIAAWRINQNIISWASVTTIVVSIILAITTFALVMNPKMNLNFKAVEQIDEKGNKTLVRPKGIVLAFSEWILIFIYLINIINIFIFTFAL